ncbi:MAG: FAD-dependent oxidoreductase [Synechocystis sp.]|nr:FAD-dependent oxidoreductase [Synechocystis sp.]
MSNTTASIINNVDVAILGGGIAGVAIAEYLARHTNLSIQLLEQAPQLGCGSSGKLEGWFHTGALYSGQDDGQTFLNCVNGVEDLINRYSPYFAPRCNLHLQEYAPGKFRPAIDSQVKGWFDPNPVYLIHPKGNCPEVQRSGLKGDRVQMELQLKRVLGRLEMAYGQQFNWRSPSKTSCLAPSYDVLESYEGKGYSLLTQPAAIQHYCQNFDHSYGLDPSDYALVQSLDCAMDTYAILRDLTASAMAHGAAIATGITLQQLNTDRYGPVRIKSVLYDDHHGDRHYLKAKVFIFAVGAGFEDILSTLQVRARLKRSRSSMIVAYPAVCHQNFVRMSTKNPYHFNHFLQRAALPSLSAPLPYSMLANSGYSPDTDDAVVDIEPLLDSAERYFGKKTLYDRQLWSYDCVKTEFISDDEQKRRYSYWIEADPHSNYLCVLPGKFSFFPTVAVQTFQRLKTLLEVEEKRPVAVVPDSHQTQADTLVAPPYPHQLLSQLPG